MTLLARRSLVKSLGMAALGTTVMRLARGDDQPPATAADIDGWLRSLTANALQLREREISALQWQEAMDRIFAAVPLEGLKGRVAFADLAPKIIGQLADERPEIFHRIDLPGSVPDAAGGKEPERVLITKLAHVRKGRSVPPHGHSNMVSAFLCLSGEFDVRQYDRLEEQEDHMVVRESVHQRAAGPGTWSSVSDYRDNVHWLTAKTDDCFLFTTKPLQIEEGRVLKGRINLDVRRGRPLGTGTFKAAKITAAEAAELY